MNITDLIVEFIQQGNVVELPGMGTLTSSNVSAHHDTDSGIYFPSRRTVILTEQQSGNKAIVRCIAERECVNTDTAEQIWANYLAALNDKLQRDNNGHEFPGLGTLRSQGGKTIFEAVEGLNLDADKHHEQPLENVSTYTPKDTTDPFAIFDRPAGNTPKTAPAEPEPAETAETSIVKPAEQEPEPVKPADPEPVKPSPVADKATEKAAKEAEREAARLAKEAEAARKAAERKAEEQRKATLKQEKLEKKNEEKARKLEEKARKRMEKASKPPRRRRLGLFWIIFFAIAILAILAFGIRHMVKAYVPEVKGENNAVHIELRPYSRFSRTIDGLHYEDYMIRGNVDAVKAYMADYIRQYLQARHYVNAYAVVMDRIGEYADLRLQDLMSDNHFSMTRFLVFDDYYRDFCYRDLQRYGGYVHRCRVQGELMDTERLDQFLDDLINELGLHPDGTVRNTAAAPVKPKAEEKYVEVVPSAPTFKASKQGFDIIAGFCTQKSKADKMANHLKSLGCDAYVINRSGLYYVSMGSAATRTAAEAMYNHIKSWYQGDITIKNFNE